MHNYALFGKGHTIHCPGQWEWFGSEVNDKSVRVKGGEQRIKTSDGYIMPLSIVSGLARLPLRPYTDREWDELPQVHVTHEAVWEPDVLDFDHSKDSYYEHDDTLEKYDSNYDMFDAFGNYRYRVVMEHGAYLSNDFDVADPVDNIDLTIDACILDVHTTSVKSMLAQVEGPKSEFFFDAYATDFDPDNPGPPDDTSDLPDDDPFSEFNPEDIKPVPRLLQHRPPDFTRLRPYFGWLSVDVIKETLARTTQYARLPQGTKLHRYYKSQNPAINTPRRNEDVTCDLVYSDTKSLGGGYTTAAIFIGSESRVADVYPLKSEKQFINSLEDNVRERGAMNRLVSDRAQSEIGTTVTNFLRRLFIGAWQTEPHQQQQNPFERYYNHIKNTMNRIMDRVGAPAHTWLLCLSYVCFLVNHTYNATINDVPMNRLTGSTCDTSVLLRFYFWQRVYYLHPTTSYPSQLVEGSGRIVGISEHVGNALTYMVLSDSSQKILHRSGIRPYSSEDANLRASLFDGDDDESPPEVDPVIKPLRRPPKEATDSDFEFQKSKDPSTTDDDAYNYDAPVFSPSDLIGRSFLMDKSEDGQQFRARVVELLEDHESSLEENPTRIKFRLSVNEDFDPYDEVITYRQLLDYIDRDDDNPVVWKYKRIVGHEGPLNSKDPRYQGSKYNVMVEWETGETTAVSLSLLAEDDPVACALYAKEHNLLETPGWKRFKQLARRHKKFLRHVNQAKLRSARAAPKYKYGFELPKGYDHAVRLDERNGNTKWQDAMAHELNVIDEYETFEDIGHAKEAKIPEDFKRIRVHWVYDVKHDGRHRARLVADGNLTEIPLESVYSGVVSLRGFRLALFLAELNGMEAWATDISSAYLEATTDEKVYIVAGPEFGDRAGHILIVRKALYGLRTSSIRWHSRLADVLSAEGFKPCKAEPDIWMRKSSDGLKWEYIAVYVDDLALVLQDSNSFVELLKAKYNFKFKGTGPMSFHLGMDICRDEDGTLCIKPAKYIQKLLDNYERTFGEKPSRKFKAPLEQGDNPELDTSELLDPSMVTIYQHMIGSLQWLVSIGRFDINTAVMTMSSFRAAPRKGHLDRVKRIYGYLANMRDACIRVRVEEPDYSDLDVTNFDWSTSVYGDVSEEIPTDAPEPLGNYVTLTHYVDANLMHDVVTGRSVTGILHLVNKFPADWFCKKQGTIQTATYGSESLAARICVSRSSTYA